MTRAAIAISGLGRCGTSLVCQMLDVGGAKVAGSFPAYEPHRTQLKPGQAGKWLDPHRLQPPWKQGTPAAVLWLDRDPVQQAFSQLKMAKLLYSGVVNLQDDSVQRLADRLVVERRAAWARITQYPKLVITFEALIEQPAEGAKVIAHWMHGWGIDLDVGRMAEQVIPRESGATPDLMIEMSLVAEAEAARQNSPVAAVSPRG